MSALERWSMLVEEVNGRTCVGMIGVRDPEAPCDAFVPGEPDGDCETDGHYMCDECVKRASCEICGVRPSSCQCHDVVYSVETFIQGLSRTPLPPPLPRSWWRW